MTRTSHIYFLLALVPSLMVMPTHAMDSKDSKKETRSKLCTSNNGRKFQRGTENLISRTESPAKNKAEILAHINDELNHHYETTGAEKQTAAKRELALYRQEIREYQKFCEHSNRVSSKIS